MHNATKVLRCAGHGVEFDLRSGRAALSRFDSAYDGDRIGIDV